MKKEIVAQNQYDQLEQYKGSYGSSAQKFIDYMKDENRKLNDATVTAYISVLKDEVKDAGISAATFNSRIGALKNIVKKYFRADGNLSRKDYVSICEYVDEIKPMKRELTVDPDDIPSKADFDKFVAQCPDETIRLLVTFLGKTGARISEALGLLVADVKPNHRFASVTLRGKRNRERKTKISMQLYNELINNFKGLKYVFEHSGRAYSRSSATARIKLQTLRLLGREYSAHAFRHMFATEHLKAGHSYSAVARALGHSDPSTALGLYAHDSLTYEQMEVV